MDFGLYRASIQSTFVPVQTKVHFRFPESDSRKPSAMYAGTSCRGLVCVECLVGKQKKPILCQEPVSNRVKGCLLQNVKRTFIGMSESRRGIMNGAETATSMPCDPRKNLRTIRPAANIHTESRRSKCAEESEDPGVCVECLIGKQKKQILSVCVCVECLIGKQKKLNLFKVTEPSSMSRYSKPMNPDTQIPSKPEYRKPKIPNPQAAKPKDPKATQRTD
jgi:hypothetical protein